MYNAFAGVYAIESKCSAEREEIKMASSKVLVNKISKFNGRNYALWRHLIKRILGSEGLYAVVFDDKLTPVTDKDKEEWLTADKEAKSIILSHLDQKHLRLTQDCEHSKGVMEKLDMAYGQRNLIRKICAEENFHSYSMRSTDTIAEHVAKVEELAQNIRDAGGEMSNVMVIDKILSSLSRKFQGVREAWLIPSKESDTLDDLKASLLKEERIILMKEGLGKFPLLKRHRRKPYNPQLHRRTQSTAKKSQKSGNSPKN